MLVHEWPYIRLTGPTHGPCSYSEKPYGLLSIEPYSCGRAYSKQPNANFGHACVGYTLGFRSGVWLRGQTYPATITLQHAHPSGDRGFCTGSS